MGHSIYGGYLIDTLRYSYIHIYFNNVMNITSLNNTNPSIYSREDLNYSNYKHIFRHVQLLLRAIFPYTYYLWKLYFFPSVTTWIPISSLCQCKSLLFTFSNIEVSFFHSGLANCDYQTNLIIWSNKWMNTWKIAKLIKE